MIRSILLLAGAVVALAACAGGAAPSGITAPSPATQLQARIDAEVAYDAGVNGLEVSFLAGQLKGSDLANARLGLTSSHVAILAARTAATANAIPSSDLLTQAESQSDADYARVAKEMSGG